MSAISSGERLIRGLLAGVESLGEAELILALKGCRVLRQLLDQFDVAGVAELERRGTFAAHGQRKPETAVASLHGIELGEARQIVVAAEQVAARSTVQGEPLPPRLPAVAKAFADGAGSVQHVAVAARVLGSRAAGRLEPHLWEYAEGELAGLMGSCTPRRLHQAGSELVAMLDQDGEEPSDTPERQVNELRITRGANGGGWIKARFDDPARFQTVLSVLDAKAAPLTADDDRTAAERQADALAEVCGFVADHGDTVIPDAGGHRPTLNLTVDLDALQRRHAAACLPFGGMLGPRELRRACCDAKVIPVVMGGSGQPLDVGRSRRTIPIPLRAAVESRDGGCAHPGCDRPISWSEIHHIKHWADGGDTALRNLVMLCRSHHRDVHHSEWEVRMAPDGIPEFMPPAWICPARTPRRQPRPDRALGSRVWAAGHRRAATRLRYG